MFRFEAQQLIFSQFISHHLLFVPCIYALGLPGGGLRLLLCMQMASQGHSLTAGSSRA